jgi:hypothetical protein
MATIQCRNIKIFTDLNQLLVLLSDEQRSILVQKLFLPVLIPYEP